MALTDAAQTVSLLAGLVANMDRTGRPRIKSSGVSTVRFFLSVVL